MYTERQNRAERTEKNRMKPLWDTRGIECGGDGLIKLGRSWFWGDDSLGCLEGAFLFKEMYCFQ